NITVTAEPVNQAPAFTADPINKANGTENAAYSGSIAGDASDPESDPMTFSKVSGPAWLSVAANGTLSGTPGAGDVGANAFTVQVDAAGGSDTATLNITVDAAGPVGWTEILYDDFEGGFGNWIDGGADCLLYTGPDFVHQGNSAANLQDDTSTSVMSTGNLTLSGKSAIQVEFWAYTKEFKPNHDFWLQISTNGGASYTTVKAWVRGPDFNNEQFFTDTVVINGYTLNDQTRLRFRCDASKDANDVWIDEVRVSVQ
ncbi:MAG TPA: putative Ig domain-containing protein, partial [Pontiella sp.]|nr:putative Ig domain-containing protein [Pontiella sp.]